MKRSKVVLIKNFLFPKGYDFQMISLQEWVNGNVNKKSEYSEWWKNMDTGLSYSIFVFFMIKIKI